MQEPATRGRQVVPGVVDARHIVRVEAEALLLLGDELVVVCGVRDVLLIHNELALTARVVDDV